MRIEHWPVDPATAHEAERNYRTAYALKLAGRPALEIVRELTFDGTASHITIEDLERLLRWMETHLLRTPFSGTGVEVGAGPLVFSSVLARFKRVRRMYGVEICEPIITQLFPGVAQDIAGPDAHKLVGVVGSFDEMKLPDASADFMFDFFSLHHSLDVGVTFREMARVLKPGGFLLMLDKARPDSYSDADLDELLDARYGPEYNRQFGLPVDTVMTRRLNGEREYRLRDWMHTAHAAGFGRFDHCRLEKPGAGAMGVVKRGISVLPPRFQRLATALLPRPTQSHRFVLDASHRIFTPLLERFRKEMSVMVMYKT